MCITCCILVDKMSDIHYDLCIIGGGINGVGIARDAAGRGLSVILVEAHDLAGATSSASSKLIHGGLRYLENYDFTLVHKALKEREILYKNASNLVWPVECILPMDNKQRPEWFLRLGLWFYDRLGGKKSLPDSRLIKFWEDGVGKPLKKKYKSGFRYFDCQVDDTRLVIMNAVDAASRGAKILTHTMCKNLKIHDGKWRVSLKDTRSDDSIDISASMVVNATGPWVEGFLDSLGIGVNDNDLPSVRLVKGSHIILPRMYEGNHAYVLQQEDGRIVFVAPYEGGYTLVGTTEEDFNGDPRDVHISDQEISYLCNAYNSGFEKGISKSDVIFTFSGVRPLLDDGKDNASKVTREHFIYHHGRYEAPLLSLYGGKLTTYRAVSQDVVDKLMQISGRVGVGWSANIALAGSNFGDQGFNEYCLKQKSKYNWLPDDLFMRYASSYGTYMDCFLRGATSLDDLGKHYGDSIYEAEIEYLKKYEWVSCAEDIIWRRSKLGLYISDQTLANIEGIFSN